MITLKPLRQVTQARRFTMILVFSGLMTAVVIGTWMADPRIGAIACISSFIVLIVMIRQKNIQEIVVDSAGKKFLVRHLPWIGELKERPYPIQSSTQVRYEPLRIKNYGFGSRDTGRHKLYIWLPRNYNLEFVTGDFSDENLQYLRRVIEAVKSEIK